MKAEGDKDHSGELVEMLTRLEELHTELAAVIERKIKCMRECDVAGMSECTANERELVGKIGEGEGSRRLLTDRLARACGLSAQKARRLTAAQLAERLPAAQGSDLLAAAGRLRSLTTRIVRRNHVAGRFGGNMLRHMDVILSAMTAPRERSGAYSSAGRTVGATPRQLFETVG